MKEEKNRLRAEIRRDLIEFTEDYIERSNFGIYENVTGLYEYKAASTLFLFCGVGREPDTLRIADHALKSGKTVAFPFCYRGGIMEARCVRDLSQLTPSMLGIPAPGDGCEVVPRETVDFILVPALAFDSEGYRLGYGGGYYDRYLDNCRAFTVGVVRSRLLKPKVPRESHDQRVLCLVTEENVMRIK